jgi:diguanylate cyclase (GGDEF)-like protein
MSFDLPTLFATTVLANAVAGVLLFLSWSQYRNIPALALWGTGFLLGSVATALLGTRGEFHDFFSITVANAVFAAGHGTMWAGVRAFVGRSAPIPVMLAGAALWLVLSQLDFIYENPLYRVWTIALIVTSYMLMSAWEFWRSREHASFSRWPIIFLLLVHSSAFFARIPLAVAWAKSPEGQVLRPEWIATVGGEILFFVFCFAYLLGSMAHERMVLRHRAEALSDDLTGVANRRAFFSRGENLVRRARMGARPASLILFDLDAFKDINDTYGHFMGDRVLLAFCKIAVESIRPNDLFARVGGEEFACLLVDTTSEKAEDIAERIRAQFAATPIEFGSMLVHATVSAGIASLEGGIQMLSELVLVADQALYRAKASGRNRLERGPAVVVDNQRIAAAG